MTKKGAQNDKKRESQNDKKGGAQKDEKRVQGDEKEGLKMKISARLRCIAVRNVLRRGESCCNSNP